jgi:sugar lactone lactonase YvrE
VRAVVFLRNLFVVYLGSILLLTVGCGGGGSNSPVVAVTPGYFTISATPSTLSITPGESQPILIAVEGFLGFTSAVAVSISGLPTGVSASPSSFSLNPGSKQSITVATAATSATSGFTLTIQGTSGSLIHSTTASVAIALPVTAAHSPLRTHYIRTDPAFYAAIPPHDSAYDSNHKQFFVSNPSRNEIDVFDAAREVETARITVPMAWGIDISSNHGMLYAATQYGDVYQINTSTLTVANRWPSASIGPSGFIAQEVFVLADGRLVLGSNYGQVVVWDPVSNSVDTGSEGTGTVCAVGQTGPIALNGDRTRVLVAASDGSVPVCSYDPSTRVASYGSYPYVTPVKNIVPTPDGNRFFLTSVLNGVGVFDAKTAQLVGRIAETVEDDYSQLPSGADGAAISLDGRTLYLINSIGSEFAAYDTTSLAQIGWLPMFQVGDLQPTLVPGAIDETGLMVGAIGHGVAFVDVSKPTPKQPTFISTDFSSQTTGPMTGGDAAEGFLGGLNWTGASPTGLYFGNVTPGNASFSNPGGAGPEVQLVTPTSRISGPVDVTIQLADGATGVAPEAFTYGPTILEITPNGSTAEGGKPGTITGYGFGKTTSDVQVTVGGKSAPVTILYTEPAMGPYPFATNSLVFTIPPGEAGSAVDVTVTTAAGSVTAAGAFHYTAASSNHSLAANLQTGIYDSNRDLYFFTDTAQIQVMSASSGNWLSPITLPGVTTTTQLLALSESPDRSKLVVSDFGGQAIYVLNPDNPAALQRFAMPTPGMTPNGVAITNSGSVYFLASGAPFPYSGFLKLDTISGAFSYIGEQTGASYTQWNRVLLSPDGSKVYLVGPQGIEWLDTSNDQLHVSSVQISPTNWISPTNFPDLSVSADGSTVMLEGTFTDQWFNAESDAEYLDWETWFPIPAVGQKLNQDGSILFQPHSEGIDLIARNTGHLLYRIQMPVKPAAVYDPIIVAKGQNTLGVLTSTGVSFIDLSTLPIDPKYHQPFPASDLPLSRLHSEVSRRAIDTDSSRRSSSKARPSSLTVPRFSDTAR